MYMMFIIMMVAVYIIDHSGFVEEIRLKLHYKNFDLADPRFDKPLFCPRCITFWTGAGMAVYQQSWDPLLWGILFSWFAPYFSHIVLAIQELIIYLVSKVEKLK